MSIDKQLQAFQQKRFWQSLKTILIAGGMLSHYTNPDYRLATLVTFRFD